MAQQSEIPEWLRAAEGTDRALTAESELFETDQGRIEYAALGTGPMVVVIHGAPGGYDQAMLLGVPLQRAGFQVVGISRPGYLRTPLASGQTYPEQAALVAKLLQHLDVASVAVMAASAGGPVAFQLAIQHPDLVACLVTIDGVTERHDPHPAPIRNHLRESKMGQAATDWMYRHQPERVVQNLLSTESTMSEDAASALAGRIVGDTDRFEFVRGLLKTMGPKEEREAGLENDHLIQRDLELPLERVRCPSLIMHARDDAAVAPVQAEHAAARIADSELYWIASGSHLAYWLSDDADEAQTRSIEFLRANIG